MPTRLFDDLLRRMGAQGDDRKGAPRGTKERRRLESADAGHLQIDQHHVMTGTACRVPKSIDQGLAVVDEHDLRAGSGALFFQQLHALLDIDLIKLVGPPTP